MRRLKMPKSILILMVLLAIIMGVYAILRANPEETYAVQRIGQSAAVPTVTLGMHEYAGSQATTSPAPTIPGISIPGWSGISFAAGSRVVSVPFYNPQSNEGWYYLTFQVRLNETEDVLFTTGLIAPGQYCNMVTMNCDLPAGKYEGTLFVQPYLMDDLSVTNNLKMPLSITVYQ
ncbi:MAG: hypothetical protein IJ438_13520 [Clostridia bacterium]|nr:hypothetical protein [Clostridia bacterium]